MRKRGIKYILAFGVIMFGILAGKKEICYAEEKPLFSKGSQVTIWQSDAAKAKVEVKLNQGITGIRYNTAQTEGTYEQVILDMIGNEVFAVEEGMAISIPYSCENYAPVYLQISLNDTKGKKTFVNGEFIYIDRRGEKKYLGTSENGMMQLEAGQQGVVLLLLSDMECKGVDLKSLYGVTCTILLERQTEGIFKIGNITSVTGKEVNKLKKQKTVTMNGTEQITIPYMGTTWYEYDIEGMDENEITFEVSDLPNGCQLGENGRIIVEDNAEEGMFEIETVTPSGYYLGKRVMVKKGIDMGYTFSTPEKMEKVTYPLSFLNKKEMIWGVRVVLCLTLLVVVGLFFWGNYRIAKSEKEFEKEEML